MLRTRERTKWKINCFINSFIIREHLKSKGKKPILNNRYQESHPIGSVKMEVKDEKRGCSFGLGEYYSGPYNVSLVLALMSGFEIGMGKGR